MNSLVEQLLDHAREQSAVTAVRDRADGAWRFLAWQELLFEVNRVAGALEARHPRGARFEGAASPGTRRLVLDLALLHLGVLHVPGGPSIPREEWDTWLSTREDGGRLVRLQAELRARDPAVVRGSTVWSQGQVLEHARRLATSLGLRSPEVALVSADAPAEQALGWAAVAGGFGLAVGGAAELGPTNAVAWVCTPEALRALVVPRRGVLDAARARLDPRAAAADPLARLRLVRVVGAVPPEAEALRSRGVEVGVWTG